jgi:hypothetical protein
MTRAIELEKFLSSKKEIATTDDVRLLRVKEDILQYMSRGISKRAYMVGFGVLGLSLIEEKR